MIKIGYLGKVSKHKKQLTKKFVDFVEDLRLTRRKVSLTISSKKTILHYDGTPCYGVIYIDSKNISILVASRCTDKIFIDTLAHEFYHLKQFLTRGAFDERGMHNASDKLHKEFLAWLT